MSDETFAPFIGPADLALFSIADTRERADRLRERLVPKLKSLVDEAAELIAEIYGPDLLTLQRIGTRPAHRKSAQRTRSFHDAHAGFHPRDGLGYFSLQIEFLSDSDQTLGTVIHAARPREAEALIAVCQDHPESVTSLCEEFDYWLWCPKAGQEWDGIQSALNVITVRHEEQWFATELVGEWVEFPIVDEDAAWNVIFDFVAMFPIFQAASDRLLMRPDRFEELLARFWVWHRRNIESESSQGNEEDRPPEPIHLPELPIDAGFGEEGGFKVAMVRHRRREKKLRKSKIREALGSNEGHLRCEVPGCGFDFLEVYGEIGERFAHVHHKNPLSGYSAPMKTRLSDLAIVCANCHAMIHRGGKCRKLDELIKDRRAIDPEQ